MTFPSYCFIEYVLSLDKFYASLEELIECFALQHAVLQECEVNELMESGMLKLDAKETTTFKLQDDFWPKAWNTEATNESAGQKNVTKTTTTLK